jgi:hypothetical protein
MKAELFSLRLSSELKLALEREARVRNVSISSVLDMAAREWLKNKSPHGADAEAQRTLHEAVENYIGAFSGHESRRSERVREIVRKRLRRRNDA